jgi:signal transduction histidine kinase/ligand-binding sensor domain-containing protein
MFKFIGTKPFTIRLKLFPSILIVLAVASCDSRKTIPFPLAESGYAQPVSRPFKFSESYPIQWKEINGDSIKPPKAISLDFEKLPSRPFTINDFKPLKSPVQVKKLDWDNIPDSAVNLDTIAEQPVNFQKSILPKPAIVRAGMPRLATSTPSGILQISTEEGLPGQIITASLVDKNGFIWIATDQGLCRYNGETFSVYIFVNKDPKTNNYMPVSHLVEDAAGRIWVTTMGDGIYVMDVDHNILLHDRSKLYSVDIICDHQGNMWIACLIDGLYLIDTKRETKKNIRRYPGKSMENITWSIAEDRQKNIWISTSNNLLILDSARKNTKKLTTNEGLVNNFSLELFEDSKGYMWIGYFEKGATFISLKEKTVSTINDKNGFNNRSVEYTEDSQGRVWMADNDSIFVLNKEKTAIKNIITNGKMIENWKGSFIKDQQQNIWFGSLNKGVFIADAKGPLPEHLDSKNGLADDNIWGLNEDKNQNIWISTYKGLNIYNPDKNQLKLLTTAQGIQNDRSNRLSENKQGDLFLISYKGFSVISSNRKTITNYGKEQGLTEQNPAQFSLPDKSNQLWVIFEKGIGRYDFEKKTLSVLEKPTGLLSDVFWDLKEDQHGNIWLGSDSGIVVINPLNNTIKYLREADGLCNNAVIKIVVRKNGEIAAATYKGISIINPDKFTITNLTASEGLIPEIQYDLLEQNGKLLAGSKDGIIVINTPDSSFAGNNKNKQWGFINYNKQAGFPFTDYNQNTAMVTRRGQTWWGVTPMLTVLTQQSQADTMQPAVYITRVSILDQYPSFVSWQALGKQINTGDTLWDEQRKKYFTKAGIPKDSGYLVSNKIEWDSLSSAFHLPLGLILPYNQNYLNFSFVNNDIKGRDKIVYRYILEGADKKWSDISDRPFSRNYYNLSPGEYTFKVATRGFNGIWSLPAAFSFTIRAPWWLTWWAYIVYAVLAAFIITTYARYRSRKLQLENTALENKINQRTAELSQSLEELKATQTQLIHSEKMASLGELTAGIAHEIQNPLNFVNNFSDINKELLSEMKTEMDKGNINDAKSIADDILNNEEKINHHGKRADSIVKGMLQHSRNNTGQRELTDINALADEYLRLSYHGLRAKDKSFNATLQTDFNQNIEKINIIPQDIGRVLLNLYNNAFYAVNEKKKTQGETYEPIVSVKTNKADSKIQIIIKDNGNGIPQSIVDKIFQPFFTTKPTGQGTGLGLSLAYDTIKAHNGEMKVQSKEGEGAEFIILLPAQ